MNLPPYTYRPLEAAESIRVLALEPASSPDDSLRCRLIHLDRRQLQKSPNTAENHYEAVSYVWGHAVFSEHLVCEGDAVVKITPNVDALLRRLRKRHRPRNLWVDAICLNQADNDEKAVQVPLMGEIYNQAIKVVVWLGHEAQDVERVFAFIRAMTLQERGPATHGEVERLILDIWGDVSLAPLHSFLHRPWFGRRWVLQEAALARTAVVQCHDVKMPWSWFTEGLSNLLATTEGSPKLDPAAIKALKMLRMLQSGRRGILSLLWNFDHSECLNLRDRLFALLGFADDIAREPSPLRTKQYRPIRFVPDYREPWQTTYTRFAVATVASGKFWELLRHTAGFGVLRNEDDSLPSWVPNWRALNVRPTLPIWLEEGAGGNMRDRIVTGNQQPEIYPVQGVRGPTILSAGLHLEIGYVFTGFSSAWDWDQVVSWVKVSLEEVPAWDKEAEHLIYSILRIKDDIIFEAEIRSCADSAYDEWRGCVDFRTFQLGTFPARDKLDNSLRCMRLLFAEYTICFFTEGKEYAICPAATRSGDVLAVHRRNISRGATYKLGFVLRPTGDKMETESLTSYEIPGMAPAQVPRKANTARLVGPCIPHRLHWPSEEGPVYVLV